jgi:hypothetical protein
MDTPVQLKNELETSDNQEPEPNDKENWEVATPEGWLAPGGVLLHAEYVHRYVLTTVGKQMERKIQRAPRQKLPVKLNIHMPMPFHLFVFGSPERTLNTDTELSAYFQAHQVRVYERNAGYAQLKPPLDLEYDEKNEVTIVKFNYAVYNGAGMPMMACIKQGTV